ncbi:unnamed protein product [Pieris macdunnoughi]|uniref:Uncharacterized protein n=1 Tax=Pieris macdunnoughi TaxID=345717 RepID=A0A821TDK1_9NEOP|nr:unnamed protein product [Pieris macdunnoughi]
MWALFGRPTVSVQVACHNSQWIMSRCDMACCKSGRESKAPPKYPVLQLTDCGTGADTTRCANLLCNEPIAQVTFTFTHAVMLAFNDPVQIYSQAYARRKRLRKKYPNPHRSHISNRNNYTVTWPGPVKSGERSTF